MAAEETANKNKAWDTPFLINGREALKKIQYYKRCHLAYNYSEAGHTGTCSIQFIHSFT